MKIKVEISVEVSGRYVPPTEAYFDKSMEQWYPGDAEDVRDLCVLASIAKGKIMDVTGLFSPDQLEVIKSKYIEYQRGE